MKKEAPVEVESYKREAFVNLLLSSSLVETRHGTLHQHQNEHQHQLFGSCCVTSERDNRDAWVHMAHLYIHPDITTMSWSFSGSFCWTKESLRFDGLLFLSISVYTSLDHHTV